MTAKQAISLGISALKKANEEKFDIITFFDLDDEGKTANIIVEIVRKRIIKLEKDPLLSSDFLRA